MRKRILLPTSFFSSLLFTIFLFGFMIGLFFLPQIIEYLDNRDSKNKTILKDREEAINVVVENVYDGDTIKIKVNKELEDKLNPKFKKELFETELYKEYKCIIVRLCGIDAPEKKEVYAHKARTFVLEKINKKCIKINWDNCNQNQALNEPNEYNSVRLLAYVYTQDEKGKYLNKSLNELMLEGGYAEIDRRDDYKRSHPKEEEFQNLEDQARKEHKGVWGKK